MESFFFRVVSAQWLASIVQQPAASVRSCKGITYEEKGRDGDWCNDKRNEKYIERCCQILQHVAFGVNVRTNTF